MRDFDLSPVLIEGMLLRTQWMGRAVMGNGRIPMGLSDGINDAGLVVAFAFGGSPETGAGFVSTKILRCEL